MIKSPTCNAWSRSDGPLYRDTRQRILEAIDSLEWRPGEAIPSEKKLAERFGISMGTLRKAVDELTASGVLIRKQGLGTFVARHSQDRYLFSFFHLVGHDGHKEYPEVRFRHFGVVAASSFAAKALGLKVGARLYHLSNILSLHGEVTSIDEIYLPAALYSGLTEKQLREREGTLYQLYQDEYNNSVVRTSERLRAFPADSDQAEVLMTGVGAPLLEIIRIAYTFQDRPIELRYSYVNTQRCEYQPSISFNTRI